MKSQQSFVVKQLSVPVGQLTIFYTDNVCTGGQLHLHQGTSYEERYTVFIKPTQTTFTIRADCSQMIEQLDQLMSNLHEGDNGSQRPDRNFMERTLHEARRIIQQLRKRIS